MMDDLISRKAAIEAAALSAAEWDGMYVQDINGRIRKALEKLPPTQPERKKGKWKVVGKDMYINLENAREQYRDLGYPHRNELKLRCSECGMLTIVDESIAYNYCPHCGAKMEGETK